MLGRACGSTAAGDRATFRSGSPGATDVDYFAGKRVLLVGASRGIGRALAFRLASRGATICVAARHAVDLRSTVAELERSSGRPHAQVEFDARDAAGVAAARDRVRSAIGDLDVLVCAAGAARSATFLDAPASDFTEMLEINYLAHVNVVRTFAPDLVARGRGDICLVSSLAALLPIYGYSAYAASKAAIAAFGEALRQEMRLHGVRVVVHHPPTTDTPGLEAENRTKPAAVWNLEIGSGWSRIHDAGAVAASVAKAIESGRPQAITGFDSWFLTGVRRLLPGIFRRVADAEVRRAVTTSALAAAGTAAAKTAGIGRRPAESRRGAPHPSP